MGLEIQHAPRISRAGFVHILEAASSPAAPVAGACFDVIMDYDLDPAIGLAMFGHESGYGLQGAAVNTGNWGNVRPPASGWLQRLGLNDGQNSSWLLFRRRENEPQGWEWLRSCEVWAILIKELYIGKWGLTTVEAAIEKYAPRADKNNPNAYATAVIRSVNLWAQQFPPAGTEPTPVPVPVTLPDDGLLTRLADIEHRLDKLEAARDAGGQYYVGDPPAPWATPGGAPTSGTADTPAITWGPATTTGGPVHE